MSRIIDLVGKAFERWLVLSQATDKAPIMWNCRCACGTERPVAGGDLKRGLSKSCGCLMRELAADRWSSHGLSRHPANNTWRKMKHRCTNPANDGYALYGGRGISVCEEWSSFEGFWADMGSTWKPGLSIDRIDTDGNYEPSNCKWSTPMEQANNRRTNNLVTLPDGRTMTITEAAREHGLKPVSVMARIRYGWPESEWFIQARPTKRKYK